MTEDAQFAAIAAAVQVWRGQAPEFANAIGLDASSAAASTEQGDVRGLVASTAAMQALLPILDEQAREFDASALALRTASSVVSAILLQRAMDGLDAADARRAEAMEQRVASQAEQRAHELVAVRLAAPDISLN